MRVLHGINDLVNDPGFLTIAKTLERCSVKNIDCDFCPPEISSKCHKYFDRTCTNCSGRSRTVSQSDVELQLTKLRGIGVLG